MTTPHFQDKFAREDGDIGSSYLIPCGGAAIFDQSVIPVDLEEISTGGSPVLEGATQQKTQVLYNEDDLDGPDYSVRGVWTRLDESYVVTAEIDAAQNDPSFTLLARMSKDPVLVDLGGQEEPACYDQGYGLRVTCPRGGTNPILKLIKFTPRTLSPGFPAAASSEPDGAVVLASVTISSEALVKDPAWDGTGNPPYQSFIQDMRFRIRRTDERVILDAYINDRHRNTPILSFTDHRHPLWGDVGLPGFEFISCAEAIQSGTSPFALSAIPIMFCNLFEVETIKDIAPARVSSPENRMTYGRIAERAILLVEKQGDAKYTASLNGQTKKDIFVNFVYEAEQDILAMEGTWWFLQRNNYPVYLKADTSLLELPEECGKEVISITPSWDSRLPLEEVETSRWQELLVGQLACVGRPRIYRMVGPQTNDRQSIEIWPVPRSEEEADELFIKIDFYARQFRALDPDAQMPLIPQEHANVLTYKAAALAMTLDTDMQNMQSMTQVANVMLQNLVRTNNRKSGRHQARMVYAGHQRRGRFGPVTRIDQLGLRFP